MIIKKDNEANLLKAIGKMVGLKAKEENFALGLPIVIEENGYVIELYKSGEKRRLKKIKPLSFVSKK